MTDNEVCVICGAGFRPNAMKGTKCIACAEKYPGAESAAEVRQANKPKAETLTDVTVKKMIYAILEEAGIRRYKCENCKNLYFRTSPAQKVCKVCKESK